MQGIDRYIMDYENLIRIPVHLYEKLTRVKKILECFACYSYDELISIVADNMELSTDEARELVAYYSLLDVSSLDEYYDIYDNIDEILSKLSKETVLSEEETFASVDSNFIRDEIIKALSTLSPKEDSVIRLRYGLDGPEKTLEKVENQFNVTRERIRQLEMKALRKLRCPTKTAILKDYYYSKFLKLYQP